MCVSGKSLHTQQECLKQISVNVGCKVVVGFQAGIKGKADHTKKTGIVSSYLSVRQNITVPSAYICHIQSILADDAFLKYVLVFAAYFRSQGWKWT